MPKTIEPIREHAKKLQEQFIKDAGVTPDPKAAALSTALPAFSKGTAPLDPNTGQPIVTADQPTEFATSTVEMPPGTETTGTQEPTAQRDDKGRFVGQNDHADQPTLTPAATTQTTGKDATAQTAQEARTPADTSAHNAAVAAQQVLDDLEAWEFEDPDLKDDAGAPIKIPLKFPKQYANIIKRAIPRRADYDRLRNRFGEAEPILRPLLEDGRIKPILPILQRAMTDEQFGNFVWQAFQRAQQGLPLVEPAQPQPQAPVAPQYGAPPAVAGMPVPGLDTPFPDPIVEAVIQPLQAQWQQRYAQLENKLTTFEERQQAEQQRQREEAWRQQQFANELMTTHRDLEQRFPGEFSSAMGPSDPNWIKAQNMARDGGYTQAYGVRAGLVLAYQAVRQMEEERLAATASPAAAALAEVDHRQTELAVRQAANLARSAGGGAPATSTPPAPKPKPTTRDANGRLKDRDTFLTEMTEWVKQQG